MEGLREECASHTSLGQSVWDEGHGARLESLLRADSFVSGVLRQCRDDSSGHISSGMLSYYFGLNVHRSGLYTQYYSSLL